MPWSVTAVLQGRAKSGAQGVGLGFKARLIPRAPSVSFCRFCPSSWALPLMSLVILKWGWFCTSWDTWQCQATFLIMTGGQSCEGAAGTAFCGLQSSLAQQWIIQPWMPGCRGVETLPYGDTTKKTPASGGGSRDGWKQGRLEKETTSSWFYRPVKLCELLRLPPHLKVGGSRWCSGIWSMSSGVRPPGFVYWLPL